jgi:5'-nucleotidase / UDP-sugar diphosphatase
MDGNMRSSLSQQTRFEQGVKKYRKSRVRQTNLDQTLPVFLAALSCALFFALPAPRGAFAQTTLTILHTSEHHGTAEPLAHGPYEGSGGVARRATLIRDIRKETADVLLVDSGDILLGSAMSTVFRGEADIAAMNLMKYDALGLGNHDFDFGIDHLQRLRKAAAFPFLCTNVVPRKPDVCQRYAIKSIGPLRIALIGLIGRKNFSESFSRIVAREVDYRDPLEAARAVVEEIREQVEVLVAITHEDTAEDLALAKAIPGLDVIIGGHTGGFDGLILPGDDRPQDGRLDVFGSGPIFVKTHRQGRTLGRLDLLYHDKTIMVAEARNLPVGPNIPPEPSQSQLINEYLRRLGEKLSSVVGQAATDLEGESAAIRRRETNLGNLLADLARREAATDIALLNAGTVRGGIRAGPVSFRQLLEILPFDSTLISLQLTGNELREVLEHGVSRLPEPSGRFLQVSGVSYTIDLHAPAGNRIQEIRVKGRPLESSRRYSVVVNQFLAEGGDGYETLLHASEKRGLDITLRDILLTALQSGPIAATVDARITTMPAPSEPAHSPAGPTPTPADKFTP